MSKPYLYLVWHDVHWPKTDHPTLRAVLDFLAQNPVAGFYFGGDQLDLEELAWQNKNKALFKLPGSYERNLKTFDRDVLTPIEALLPKGACRVWHTGNHERRVQDVIEEQPELQGAIELEKKLRLVERGWKVIPLGHASKIGKLVVVHGEVLTGIGNQGGLYSARKAVDLYGAPVLAGHTHSPQSYTRIAPVEKLQKHMGWIAPIGGKVNPTYLRNRPTAWLNGCVIVEQHGASGAFNLYPVIVTNGKFAYGGKVYGANASVRGRSRR